jgi:hypothetical protein|uniref:hypothetical protein n=1 Tax=Neopestalotiopsis cubana TaxID=1562163 RepID=UPI00233F084E|nr:hypothetical protein PQ570_mgp22 [Neopestalotiopsis cubana]WBU13053.1 hypothetical protein [Neopestalotiopsis cubana]
MKNFNEFTKINNKIYSIDLFSFDYSESFSLTLLDFLGKYSISNKNLYEDCAVYFLVFTDGITIVEVPFLFPFVDKTICFKHIYNTFILSPESENIYLIINN